MAEIKFPSVFAQCQVDGSTIGHEGSVPVIVSSFPNAAVFAESGHDVSGVGAGGTSRPLTGKPLHVVGANDLKHFAALSRGCAAAVQSPSQQASLRQLAIELDKMAARRLGDS
jgi:hypothetical protein